MFVHRTGKAPSSPDVTVQPWVYGANELRVSLALVVAGFFYLFHNVWQMTRKFTDPSQLQGLQPGTLFDRPVDMYDRQWRMFLENLPLAVCLACMHVALGRAARHVLRHSYRLYTLVELCFGLIWVVYLHGADTIYLVAICWGSFGISRISLVQRGGRHVSLLQKAVPLLTWAYGLGALLSLSMFSWFRFGCVHVYLWGIYWVRTGFLPSLGAKLSTPSLAGRRGTKTIDGCAGGWSQPTTWGWRRLLAVT